MGGGSPPQEKITVPWVVKSKGKEQLVMLTAYDYLTARILNQTGVEMVLVGDSLAMVLYGEATTLPVTMEEMLRHTRSVSSAIKRAVVIGDMPFLSYQEGPVQALRNGGRFLKEAGANAVKLEGGLEMVKQVKALVRSGIPVMGHIGLTPQSIHALGGYRMQGKTAREKDYLLKSARALEEAGVFSIVLECIEETLAAEITKGISVPTIGIGSGLGCDGQVLVTQDLVGLTQGHIPKFVRPLANLQTHFLEAVNGYVDRTKKGF